MALYGRTFGRIAVEAVRRTGSFASGRSYIQKYFPPGYREPATKLIKAFEQAAGGAGLYQVYQTFIAEDTPGNRGQIQQKPPTRKPYKTRFRRTGRIGSRYSTKRKSYQKCRCPSHGKYQRSTNRMYS